MKILLRLAIAVVALEASCVSRPPDTSTRAGSEKEAARAIALMSQTCADAWNRGDLNGYLAAYAKDVVMVYQWGPEKGIALLEARLRQAQRSDGHRPSNLARIGRSEVTLLGPDDALQTAEILIQEPTREVALWATALLKRTGRGWIVIHEQSF
jgi:ketosteroid isomerase-like protein